MMNKPGIQHCCAMCLWSKLLEIRYNSLVVKLYN